MAQIRKRRNLTTSGNYGAGVATGTVTGGSQLSTRTVSRGTLSCLFTLVTATTGVTQTPRWQVSADASTWYTIRQPSDVAPGVMSTGVQTSTSRVIAAPAEALGWNYVRPVVVTGGDTAVTADTYSMRVQYVAADDFDMTSW
jgi:hypothetical protein